MTEYICKCGRTVQKSTNAETTGNRDTADCAGCPYRMTWGPMQWNEDRRAYVAEVKGHECRMSQYLNYASELHGSLDDKTVLSLYSLDFDFLDKVCRWIRDTYPNKEIEAHFDRNRIRTSEYSGCGRYRLAICCAGNRKGIAAKKALAAKFFTSKGVRKDMTPEQEKEKILNDIVTGCITREDVPCIATPDETDLPTAPPPACPAECGTAEPALPAQSPAALAAASTTDMADRPGFDYSGLSQRTINTMHLAEQEIRDAKQIYIVRVSNAVAIVHEALCDTVVQNLDNGKFSPKEETFRAWCAYMGFSKSTAYNLLQVDRLLSGASPEELATLEAASPSLLYAAAKPSAPAELVQAVKDGDITTHKQYQELLRRLQQLEDANADLQGTNDSLMQSVGQANARAAEARTREEEARAAAHHYHLKAEEAEAQRNAYVDRESEHLARIAELEARPIEVTAVDPDELNRRAQALADRQTAALRHDLDAANRLNAKLSHQIEQLTPDKTDHLRTLCEQAAAACRNAEAVLAAWLDTLGEEPNDVYREVTTFAEEFADRIRDAVQYGSFEAPASYHREDDYV